MAEGPTAALEKTVMVEAVKPTNALMFGSKP